MKQLQYDVGPPVVRIGPKRDILIKRGEPSPPLADDLAAQLLARPFPVFIEAPDKGKAKPSPVKAVPQSPASTTTTQEV